MTWRLEQFVARVCARIDRAKKEGLQKTALWLLDLCMSAVLWVGLLPVILILHIAGFRRSNVITSRIGHLAGEPDSFMKARALGMVGPGHYFMLAPLGNVANKTMLDYWRSLIPVIEHPVACWLLGAMSRWRFMKHEMNRYVLRLNASQEIYRINTLWQGRPPLLRLSQADIDWSEEQFARLGLPKGAWFVCVHVREPGFSPIDEDAHAYRNGDPHVVYAAVEEIVRRGGWCVRMGHPSMTPMESMPGLIDYAHHPLRSERLDVLLCARARFFLGNTSGLTLVSSVFGAPSILVNLIPLSVMPFLPGDIGIPKLLRSRSDGRILPFSEIMNSPVGDFRYTQLYKDAGLEPIENTPEEILDVVVEMLDRLDGAYVTTPNDTALQQRFKSLFRPGNYAYGAASRVGTSFLRKYENLLPPDGKSKRVDSVAIVM